MEGKALEDHMAVALIITGTVITELLVTLEHCEKEKDRAYNTYFPCKPKDLYGSFQKSFTYCSSGRWC